ncbi:hypothetical protein HPB47_023073 [Ixodes persulcatus]|uniref:Uncharacterized protein n=1 Tax=Ixodes persulcatus TaxID=34615 RepID=A0AC60Q7X6_IXOPE|nr:hypothetical protein HPB47_023073 [Ixodes persulcatus]
MKSVRNKLQKDMPSSLVDINNCNLHKVHNAFAKGLDAFGSDVEEVVRNVYYYFKSTVRAEALGECQEALGIASHVFLRHVSNRWLTLQDSLCRVLEQFEALKSYFHKASMTKQRVDTQNLHSKLAAAFSKKDLYAKVLFLKNCAELFSRFQTLFQKQEPLLHILHAELLSLVQRILSRCLRSAAYVDKSAEELKKLDVQDSTLWKTKPEVVGMDTEQAMLKWDPGEKKRLLLGARAFYLACSKDLLQKLPLDNKVLQHTSLLRLQPSDVESEFRSLRYLASQLPQVLESDLVSSLVDEWHLLRCDSANSLPLMEDGRIDTRWATVFQQKCAAGQQKYPLLSRLRGFSENKHLLEGRASLCIASINGLRQVKTYLQRYDGDATKVPLSPDLLRSVKRARARYEERIGSREADMKRKKPDSAQVDADNSHDKRLKKQLEERVISCRALLKRAEETIGAGLKCQSLEKVEGGQTMLAEANATLHIYIYMGGEVRLTRAATALVTGKRSIVRMCTTRMLFTKRDCDSDGHNLHRKPRHVDNLTKMHSLQLQQQQRAILKRGFMDNSILGTRHMFGLPISIPFREGIPNRWPTFFKLYHTEREYGITAGLTLGLSLRRERSIGRLRWHRLSKTGLRSHTQPQKCGASCHLAVQVAPNAVQPVLGAMNHLNGRPQTPSSFLSLLGLRLLKQTVSGLVRHVENKMQVTPKAIEWLNILSSLLFPTRTFCLRRCSHIS